MGVNAGNPAPLVSGRPIAAKGMPLGAARTSKYVDFELILEPGDTLAVLSDGLTDARNALGERFGEKRLADLAAAHSGRGAADLVAAIREALSEFQGVLDLYDDLTIVALRRACAR
jgi:serine phosphatase RsbU (regulator of sigma subunit)